MKKNTYFTVVLAVLLTAALAVSLAACNNTAQSEGTQSGTTEGTVDTTAATDGTTETTLPVYSRPAEDEEEEDPFQENNNEDVYYQEDDAGDSSSDQGSSSGSTGSAEADDTGDTFADGTVASNPQGNAKNLTWANINSFPIKSGSMSTAQLRALCVDFFRFAKTALWTPDESISYIRNAKGSSDSMTGGTLYGGLPYVGSSNGNIYRLMDYIDESTGKVDMSDALNLTGGKLDMAALKYFGNQCANGAHVGWGRVINSVTKFHTAGMTKANGYIPLGSYTYDTANIKTWKDADGRRTTDVVKANGEQVMYQSYALLQPADGLVYYTTAGHVIMCATAAHVEYISGSDLIDGSKSYITIIDQAQKWESYTASNGKIYQIKSSVDAQVTFEKLFSSNYVPFTFGEFNGSNGVEATTCSFSHSGGEITKSQLFSANVTSNYGITDAYAIVTDSSGKQVYKHAVRNSSSFGKTLNMAQSGANVDSWGTLSSGTYTVKVEVQLATGERLTVYTGTLSA